MSRTRKDDLEALIEAAFAAGDEGDVDAALEQGREALAIDDADPEANHVVGWALVELGRFRSAIPHLKKAGDRAEVFSLLGEALAETWEIEAARDALRKAIAGGDAPPDAHWWMGVIEERVGSAAEARRHFKQASKLDPDLPRGIEVSEDEFQKMVESSIAALPEAFRKHLDNVAIIVEPFPERAMLGDSGAHDEDELGPTIFGLYTGTPLPERSGGGAGHLPNTIHLFQKNLQRAAKDHDDLAEEIETTLLHEIGHYLGLDEDDVAERGLE